MDAISPWDDIEMNSEIKSRWECRIEKLISFFFLSDGEESLKEIAFENCYLMSARDDLTWWLWQREKEWDNKSSDFIHIFLLPLWTKAARWISAVPCFCHIDWLPFRQRIHSSLRFRGTKCGSLALNETILMLSQIQIKKSVVSLGNVGVM